MINNLSVNYVLFKLYLQYLNNILMITSYKSVPHNTGRTQTNKRNNFQVTWNISGNILHSYLATWYENIRDMDIMKGNFICTLINRHIIWGNINKQHENSIESVKYINMFVLTEYTGGTVKRNCAVCSNWDYHVHTVFALCTYHRSILLQWRAVC